jgi:hypothetical protein
MKEPDMPYLTRRRLAVLLLAATMAALGAGGCQWLTAWMFAERHPMKDVKAEYALTADRLVIVPYASTEVLFTDSMVAVEISRDLINEIMKNLGATKIKTIVHPVEVQRWQDANLEWPNMSLSDIGKTFQADTVLYVELERYSMIEENSANLYRGRVRARIQVVHPGAERNPAYDTVVETVFPADGPAGVTSTTEQMVRTYTNLVFASDVAQHFYDHKVEIKGGEQ